MLEISEKAGKKAGAAILVTGAARSGTTIAGKIIHSFSSVEYIFEPPTMFSLMSLIGAIPAARWKLLYETYLYEDFYLNALAGRSINCNLQDDSSIYRVKDEEKIRARLEKSLGKQELEQKAESGTIAYKMPDILGAVPTLLDYYPQTRVVLVRRHYAEIIHSLYNKQWFTNENARKNLLWPFVVYKDIQIPFWVGVENHEQWHRMDALNRCAWYTLTMMKRAARIENRLDLDYNALTVAPLQEAEKLAASLGLSFGLKTKEVLMEVKPARTLPDLSFLEGIEPPLREELFSFHPVSGKAA